MYDPFNLEKSPKEKFEESIKDAYSRYKDEQSRRIKKEDEDFFNQPKSWRDTRVEVSSLHSTRDFWEFKSQQRERVRHNDNMYRIQEDERKMEFEMVMNEVDNFHRILKSRELK